MTTSIYAHYLSKVSSKLRDYDELFKQVAAFPSTMIDLITPNPATESRKSERERERARWCAERERTHLCTAATIELARQNNKSALEEFGSLEDSALTNKQDYDVTLENSLRLHFENKGDVNFHDKVEQGYTSPGVYTAVANLLTFCQQKKPNIRPPSVIEYNIGTKLWRLQPVDNCELRGGNEWFSTEEQDMGECIYPWLLHEHPGKILAECAFQTTRPLRLLKFDVDYTFMDFESWIKSVTNGDFKPQCDFNGRCANHVAAEWLRSNI